MATITVRPTGLFPLDRNRIQEAIEEAESGDTVLLKATNILGRYTPFNCGGDTPIDQTTVLRYSDDPSKQTFATRELVDPNSNPDGGPVLRNKADNFLSRILYINKDITLLGELLDNDDGDYDETSDLRLVEDWSSKRTCINGSYFEIGNGYNNLDAESPEVWGEPTVHFKKLEMKNAPGLAVSIVRNQYITFSRVYIYNSQPRVQYGGFTSTSRDTQIAAKNFAIRGIEFSFPWTVPSGWTFEDNPSEEWPLSGGGKNTKANFIINRCKFIMPDGLDANGNEITRQQPTALAVGLSCSQTQDSVIQDSEFRGRIYVSGTHGPTGYKIEFKRNVFNTAQYSATAPLAGSNNQLMIFRKAPISFPNGFPFFERSLILDGFNAETIYGGSHGYVEVTENEFNFNHINLPVGQRMRGVYSNTWVADDADEPSVFSNNILNANVSIDNHFVFFSLPARTQGIVPITEDGSTDGKTRHWTISNNVLNGGANSPIRMAALNNFTFPGTALLEDINITGNNLTGAWPLIPPLGDYRISGLDNSSIVALDIQGLRPNTYNISNISNTTITGSGISLS